MNGRNGKEKRSSHCKCIITFEIWKAVINTFVMLPKMSKEVNQVQFALLKNWDAAVDKR